MEATSLILSELVSVLLLYLLEVFANRVRDDVKAETLAAMKATRETYGGVAAMFSGMNCG